MYILLRHLIDVHGFKTIEFIVVVAIVVVVGTISQNEPSKPLRQAHPANVVPKTTHTPFYANSFNLYIKLIYQKYLKRHINTLISNYF
jgi:hypothetical protein